MLRLRSGPLSWRRWALALPATVAIGVGMGVPTAIIPTPFFARMVPAGPVNYLSWALTSLLLGLIAVTYVGAGEPGPGVPRDVAGGGVLSLFAVACPVCNKVVVLALGASGALTYFAPLQPLIGAASVALLLYALRLRLRAIDGACPVPKRAPGH